jgi:hypothetical protein
MHSTRRSVFVLAGGGALCVALLASGMAWRETTDAVLAMGEVHGFVSISYGGRAIRLPNASVVLTNLDVGGAGPTATTNAHGRFDTELHPNGRYAICVSAPDVPRQCSDDILTLNNEALVLTEDFQLLAPARSTHGRVQFSDGTSCYGEDRFTKPIEITRVSLLDANNGAVMRGSVTANSEGEFVIGNTPAGPAIVLAECSGSRNVRLFDFKSDTGPNGSAVALAFQNQRPRFLSAAVTGGNGAPARYPRPGDVVTVTANVDDADHDPLHYEWIAASGEILNNCDMPSISWRLPSATAMNVLTVRVTDTRGGVAFRTVRVASGTAPQFSGRVIDAVTSAPIAGASVRVNNGPVVLTTQTGAFLVSTTPANRYALSVDRPEYAMSSQVHPEGRSELTVPLTPALRVTCGLGQACSGAQPGPRGMSIDIPAGAFVDAAGRSATVPINVDFLAYDLSRPNAIPGGTELAGRNGGRDVALRSYGAFSVNATDGGGRRYNLRPGSPARVSLVAQTPGDGRRRSVRHGVSSEASAGAVAPPPTIGTWRYDEATGIWMKMSEARLTETGAYDMVIPTFSAWNADVEFNVASCAQITVDEMHTSYPFRIRFNVNGTIVDVVVTDQDNILRLLPPFTNITAEVHPVFGPDAILGTYQINTGAAASSLYPTNYADCNAIDVATGTKPTVISLAGIPAAHQDQWLSRKIPSLNAATEASEYYTQIGAKPAKDKLSKWLLLNGFPANEVVTYYYNAVDLGFGRQMHCRQTGVNGAAACYVTNFGTNAGGSPDIAVDRAVTNTAPIATVAMEYTPPAGAADSVKFYVYDGNGDLQENATLDSEGPKPSPFICLSCHGGNYNSSTNSISGASFREFDVFTFLYHPTLPAFQLSAQQENFRKLNKIVKETSPAAANPNSPIIALIDGMYTNGGVSTPNTVPVDTYLPPLWAGESALYQEIPRNFCRACHIAQSSGLDWTNGQTFKVGLGPFIGSKVCGPSKVMPHAEVPFKKFWLSGAPSYLSNALALNGCVP